MTSPRPSPYAIDECARGHGVEPLEHQAMIQKLKAFPSSGRTNASRYPVRDLAPDHVRALWDVVAFHDTPICNLDQVFSGMATSAAREELAMNIKIRRLFTISEERREEAGRSADIPLRRTAAVAVIENPHVGRYVQDLKPMIDASAAVGEEMAQLAMAAFGRNEVQSYGKGGLVGLGGEQEHANALLTTAFADPFRRVIGSADAWISSFTKVGPPGTPIDIPMNHKGDVYVRSHYDGMTIALADTPMPDEIALIFCIANRGRLNARVGGLTHDELMARHSAKR